MSFRAQKRCKRVSDVDILHDTVDLHARDIAFDVVVVQVLTTSPARPGVSRVHSPPSSPSCGRAAAAAASSRPVASRPRVSTCPACRSSRQTTSALLQVLFALHDVDYRRFSTHKKIQGRIMKLNGNECCGHVIFILALFSINATETVESEQ